MFYARYGAGPPGQTPWRLGRGLKPRFADRKPDAALEKDDDTNTFMTRAHIDLQDKLPNTSLDLWQQFSSNPIQSADLQTIKKWVTSMRPRSIHDFKPLLMLCQALLKDLSTIFDQQLSDGRAEMQAHFDSELADARSTFNSEVQVRALRCMAYLSNTRASHRACQSASICTAKHPYIC
jgi:hypothetical protein